jgi:MFS transporter, DHA1 family, tetracycline resistance protein
LNFTLFYNDCMKNQAAIGFIFITLLIDVIGWGLIIPVMPELISGLKHISVNEASKEGGWLLFVYALMQFFCAPILGNLSDQFGRRPVLLFSLFGFGVDYIFMGFAPTFGWLFLGRTISGITGASFTTANAYIADISTAETRSKNFGMIGAAFGLGFIIGPAIGGLLTGWGIRAPFYAAAALALLNWVYGYFVLPESLVIEHRRKFEWKRANPFVSIRNLKKYPAVTALFLALFLDYLAAHAIQSTWSYFTAYRFQWTPRTIGISLTVVGILVSFVQGVLIRVITPRIGNDRSIYIGLLLNAVGMFLFALANQSWMMFVFLVPYCLGGIAAPALQATISGHVPPNAQGELQGSITSLTSITAIIGPLLMTNLFAYFTSAHAPVHFPGASFLLGGLLMLTGSIVAYKSLKQS